MTMKQQLKTTLLATLIAAMLVTPAWANEELVEEDLKAAAPAFPVTRAFPSEALQVLEGTVKEVRELELVVVNGEGQEYTVSVLPFLEQEAYQEADIKAGDSISIKGVPVEVSVTLGQERLDAARENLSLRLDAINKEAITIISVTGDAEMEEIGLEAVDRLEAMKADAQMTTLTLTEGPRNKAFKRAGEISISAVPLEGNFFIAHEITANGITVELPESTDVRPIQAFRVKFETISEESTEQ